LDPLIKCRSHTIRASGGRRFYDKPWEARTVNGSYRVDHVGRTQRELSWHAGERQALSSIRGSTILELNAGKVGRESDYWDVIGYIRSEPPGRSSLHDSAREGTDSPHK